MLLLSVAQGRGELLLQLISAKYSYSQYDGFQVILVRQCSDFLSYSNSNNSLCSALINLPFSLFAPFYNFGDALSAGSMSGVASLTISSSRQQSYGSYIYQIFPFSQFDPFDNIRDISSTRSMSEVTGMTILPDINYLDLTFPFNNVTVLRVTKMAIPADNRPYGSNIPPSDLFDNVGDTLSAKLMSEVSRMTIPAEKKSYIRSTCSTTLGLLRQLEYQKLLAMPYKIGFLFDTSETRTAAQTTLITRSFSMQPPCRMPRNCHLSIFGRKAVSV